VALLSLMKHKYIKVLIASKIESLADGDHFQRA
jgi:hypothetical protein